MAMDETFLWDGEVTDEEYFSGYQRLIDSGIAWRLEGRVGRTAMNLIREGYCTLGEVGNIDAYGNYVPSKTEVEPGTPGSEGYKQAKALDRLANEALEAGNYWSD